MPNVDFAEILFADDTLIFAAQGPSMEAMLWAIEAVSAVYGLGLNRNKCAKISLKTVADIVFNNDEKVPEEIRVEYLGGMVNAWADPQIEVNRRISAARYVWIKLKLFWREGLLTIKDKIRIYDTLIASKLMYGLHTAPLKNDLLNQIDAFHFKGLRQILKLRPTYLDRDNTNLKVLQIAEDAVNKWSDDEEGQRKKKQRIQIRKISDRILGRQTRTPGAK